jgi:D-alanyl-lipoteichoic acid acyltransferase DltB (MBOAT superfamily)
LSTYSALKPTLSISLASYKFIAAPVSLTILLFIVCTVLIYYLVPKKAQWIVLLVSSLVFYIVSSTWGILFVLLTSLTVYISAMWMTNVRKTQKAYIKENKEFLSSDEKKSIKAKANKKRKKIMIATLLLNFGVLCVFKYSHFAVEQINNVIGIFGGTVLNNDFNFLGNDVKT